MTTTGVTAEAANPDRTWYTARGFDMTDLETDRAAALLAYGNSSGGLTLLKIEGLDGETAPHQAVRRLLHAAASCRLVALPPLRFGAAAHRQDAIARHELAQLAGTMRRDGYAPADTFVRYAISGALTASLNVGDLTDRKCASGQS